jgi:transposase-like protein
MAGSVLDGIGLEPICQRIENGESQAEIAKSLGVAASTLSAWLNKPENSERSARAREMSAESWLDRGLETLEKALLKEAGYDASAAKAYAQECARRAAIRNPRYVEKRAHEHAGPNGEPMQFQAIERRIVRPDP